MNKNNNRIKGVLIFKPHIDSSNLHLLSVTEADTSVRLAFEQLDI